MANTAHCDQRQKYKQDELGRISQALLTISNYYGFIITKEHLSMAFDAVVLAAVARELQEELTGGKIDRVFQPEKDMIIMHVRRAKNNYRLLASAHAVHGRVHLTTTSYANPAAPPMFCMVLRKHLEGGRITSIFQPDMERVLQIRVEATDELGDRVEKLFVCEIMGKHSNLLLLDPGSATIIDAYKRYSHATSRYREVLPGRPYLPPPPQGKLNPLGAGEEEFRQRLLESPLDRRLPRALLETVSGLSPEMSRELILRAGLDLDLLLDNCGDYELNRVWEALHQLIKTIKKGRYQPTLVIEGNSYTAFSAVDLLQYPGKKVQNDSISHTLDIYFSGRREQDKLHQFRTSILSTVDRELDRNCKKLSLQEETITAAGEAESYREAGELITANIYRMQKGQDFLDAENFYLPEAPLIRVTLEPTLTPAENAQKYFRRYNKARSTREMASLQATQTREEIRYLQEVQFSLNEAESLQELEEVRQELVKEGYIPAKPTIRGKKKEQASSAGSQPLSFMSTAGMEILVGRNNRQNDHLTMRMAKDRDLWLHTKEIPGAHVVIRTGNGEIPPETMEEAAVLAAYYSKARDSAKVPVDCTFRSNVWKPRGAKPGMVLYENHRTFVVTPSREIIERLTRPPQI
ncbi:MAG: Rqc2 family fibronectin-binding protein [Bacillota bacterium]